MEIRIHCFNYLSERPELKVGVDGQRVPRHDPLLPAVHDDAKLVGGRLGADAEAGEVLAQKVADERRLP